MKKIYISGPYSDDNVISILRNIGRGQYYSALLFKMGFAPFCPWSDKDFVIALWQDQFSVQQFYEYSLAWLRVSDALFIVPDQAGLKNWQESHGTKLEYDMALRLKIPIFFDVEELKKWSEFDV